MCDLDEKEIMERVKFKLCEIFTAIENSIKRNKSLSYKFVLEGKIQKGTKTWNWNEAFQQLKQIFEKEASFGVPQERMFDMNIKKNDCIDRIMKGIKEQNHYLSRYMSDHREEMRLQRAIAREIEQFGNEIILGESMCKKKKNQKSELWVSIAKYKSGMEYVKAPCPFCNKKNYVTVQFHENGKIDMLNGNVCEHYHGVSERHIVFEEAQKVSQPSEPLTEQRSIFDE